MRLFTKPSRRLERLGNFDIGKSGELPADLIQKIELIRQLPVTRVDTETTDGIRQALAVRPLLLSNQRIFQLVHALAPYKPLLFAQTRSNKAKLGILSANFDSTGERRLPAIKFLPLSREVPLTSKLQPDVRAAVMLTGAANTEGPGMGNHSVADIEQRLTIMGAVSLRNPQLALTHRNHLVRSSSAVSTGLTDGQLGDLYRPQPNGSEFPGYGAPQVFEAGRTAATLYMPDSFLDTPNAFGVSFANASDIMITAGMQTLETKFGDLSGTADQLDELSRKVQAGTTAVHARMRA